MKAIVRTALAAILIVVIMLCAILVAQKLGRGVQADLTQDRLYTLSQGTQNILAKLNQPIRLKLYYSKTAALKAPEGIRFYINYYVYVRDLLQAYVGLSKGRLTLDEIDPRPYTDAEEEAMRCGIQRIPMENDEAFFFGLVAQTELGKQETIPFFEPNRQEFAEYDVSRMISALARRQKKRVAVLSSLDLMGPDEYTRQMMQYTGRQAGQTWHIIEHLRKDYDVENVAADATAIPADADFLLVVQPKNLGDSTLYAIDQYVMGGGRLIVFEDPFCLTEQRAARAPYGAAPAPARSDLNALLGAWGVRMDPEALVADPLMGVKVQPRMDRSVVSMPVYLQLDDTAMNRSEVVSAPLHSVAMFCAGALRQAPEAGTTVTPLLSTSAEGGTWKPANEDEMLMAQGETIAREMKPAGKPVMLGAVIRGTLKSNFPDGLPRSDTDAAAKPTALKQSGPKAMVIVFSDVDMLANEVAYRQWFLGVSPAGDNAAVLFNAMEYMAGDEDLITVRSRGQFSRPFAAVDRIEAEAEKSTRDQVEAINKRIAEYQQKLDQLGGMRGEDQQLIQGQALAERKKVQEDMRAARKELRDTNAGKLAAIDALKRRLLSLNLLVAPGAVLGIAVALGLARWARARYYAARRES